MIRVNAPTHDAFKELVKSAGGVVMAGFYLHAPRFPCDIVKVSFITLVKYFCTCRTCTYETAFVMAECYVTTAE